MNFPRPTLGPPPIPDDAAPWLVVKVVGKPMVRLAWELCYWSGFATCLLLVVAILGLIQFARRPR